MTDATADRPRIEIIRDHWGIPHITADSARHALYGQGYATGIDRAWQLEFLRLRAEGRTAEIFGRTAVGWDEFARRTRLDRAARRIYAASSPRTRDLVRAYADGVSATLATADAPELTEFEHRPAPWQPWTPIAVFLVHHIMFGRMFAKLWRWHAGRVLGGAALTLFDFEGADEARPSAPAVPDDAFLAEVFGALPEGTTFGTATSGTALDQPSSGSNAWAVAPHRTATGAALIAGDPHRFLELPGIYQQVQLASPDFDVVGFAFAGVPGVPHFGHAGPVAWGITNAMADYQDLYLEQLTRTDPGVTARTPDGRCPATVETDEIRVRGAAPVRIELITTDNGPVVFGGPDASFALSLRSPMLDDPATTFDAVIDLLYATSAADVERALHTWVEPVNRIVVADAGGAVTRHVAGRVPDRAPENHWLPVPGWDARFRWRGYIRPTVSDDTFDAAVTDFAVIANQRITEPAALQFPAEECAPSFRADRITERLGADAAVTVDDCADIHRDVVLSQATALQATLAGLTGLSRRADEIRRRIVGWDRTMAADSTDAYLFAAVRSALVIGLSADPGLSGLTGPHPLPPTFDPWFVPTTRIAAGLTAVLARAPGLGIDVDRAAAAALEAVAADLGDRTPPVWSSVHVLHPIHGIDLAGVAAAYPDLSQRIRPDRYGLGGDAECVFANAAAVGSYVCVLGSAARYVWDLSDRDAGRWVVPLGASGDPRSPNFQDQTPIWACGELITIVSNWFELREHAASVQVVPPPAVGATGGEQ
ncbi:penicillin acylase family protein [Skermania piniformis]|uniref:Penicillin acylase family protein n=1 Tax=Skermania pinensis TaxID=39122 RepID=A0ABX8S8K1_9ACTN|nr:penicillin acylase family protein [Skermania piniformis]QXQ13322.1 penicillin acylase family protein [Skermania piniformis]